MTPTSDPSPQQDKRKITKKAIIAGLVILLALGAIAYIWAHTNQKDDKPTDVITDVQEDGKITDALPNGKTITYDDTRANLNITWASSSKGDDYLELSHKAIGKFIANADQEIVTKLCGANGELATKSEIVGTISTTVRTIEYPTEASCLDTLATPRNTDATLRAEASRLAKQVKADIKQFYMTAVIK